MQEQANFTSTSDSEGSVEALRDELTKWQARVPKLALALRERSQELETVKAQLMAHARENTGEEVAGSGIAARDSLIAELEAKLKAQTGKQRDNQGQLHARDVEITQLREEVSQWREKWQSVTESLDAQANVVAAKETDQNNLRTELDNLRHVNGEQDKRLKDQDLELTGLRESAQSLEGRNQKLFETTEMANRQIESLGDSLGQLREQVREKEERLAGMVKDSQAVSSEMSQQAEQVKSRDQDIEFLHNHVETKQTEINALNEKLADFEKLIVERDDLTNVLTQLRSEHDTQAQEMAQLSERLQLLDKAQDAHEQLQASVDEKANVLAAVSQTRDELQAQVKTLDASLGDERKEIKRLEDCVAQADSVTEKRDAERRQISEQMAELKTRNQHLEAQLAERSNLVVGLEQEKTEIDSKTSSLESENVRLSEALEKAQRNSGENAEHVAQLDSKLERQRQLMEDLEVELVQVKNESAAIAKEHGLELRKRDDVLAEREEQFADLRQELECGSSQTSDDEERIAELKENLARSGEASAAKAAEAEALTREIAQLRSQEDAARNVLSEKVTLLEKQLRKQTKATTAAEVSEAATRVELKALKGETKRDDAPTDKTLSKENKKLEGMVRERTEQLNKLRWQQEMAAKSQEDGGENMLVVLNQQLSSSRADNKRLLDRLRELESSRAGNADSPTGKSKAKVSKRRRKAPDNLARIRGIGPKLVIQLKGLGIVSFDQIACLSAADLDDVKHVLHPFKKRIERDDWISQAAALSNGV